MNVITLQIFICGISICSTNISGDDTRYPGDQAILWACAINLIGSLDSGKGEKTESQRDMQWENPAACTTLRTQSVFHKAVRLRGMWFWIVLCSNPLIIWVILSKLLNFFEPPFPWLYTEIIPTIQDYGDTQMHVIYLAKHLGCSWHPADVHSPPSLGQMHSLIWYLLCPDGPTRGGLCSLGVQPESEVNSLSSASSLLVASLLEHRPLFFWLEVKSTVCQPSDASQSFPIGIQWIARQMVETQCWQLERVRNCPCLYLEGKVVWVVLGSHIKHKYCSNLP